MASNETWCPLSFTCLSFFESSKSWKKVWKHLTKIKKKHSKTCPDIQFKELSEKLRFTLPEKQINSTMPAKTQTKSSQKIEKQTNKLNKFIVLHKTWKLLPLRHNLTPWNIPISKICSKPKFVSEIGAVLYLQGLKKFNGPWRSINSKIFKIKKYHLKRNVAENRDINILRIISWKLILLSLEAIR